MICNDFDNYSTAKEDRTTPMAEQQNSGVYLDTNATTPLAQEVKQAIVDAMENAWGNPSSSHQAGRSAKQV